MSLTPLHTLSNDSTAPAVLFAGQGSAWQKAIADAAASPHQAAQLRDILKEVRTTTGPVARIIASSCPGVYERLEELANTPADESPVAKEYDAYPAYSIPGIVLGQIGAIEHLRELGVDVDSAQLAGQIGRASCRERV